MSEKDDQPLAPSKEAAYAMPGEIFQHYKGGVYRKVGEVVDKINDSDDPIVIYEHLWPHKPERYARYKSDFEGVNSEGKPRFERVAQN